MKASPPPPSGRTATRSEFAIAHGWAPSYVTKLIAKGRLVLTPDGKRIEVEASERLLKETARVDRQGVREHHARRRGEGTPAPAVVADPAPPPSPSGDGTGGAEAAKRPSGDAEEYNRARAQKEAALAAMAVMDQRKRSGELVEIAQVREMAARIAGIIATGFERLGPRIGSVWAAELDPGRRERLLDDELRKVQVEWADEIGKLTGGHG